MTEDQAVAALERLAARWPKTLGLFSWSGSLCVVRLAPDGSWPHPGLEPHVITTIQGIVNDGGEPD